MPKFDGPDALAGASGTGVSIADPRSDPYTTSAKSEPIARRPSADPKRMRLRKFRPMRRNTLRGFADVTLPMGLEIDDIAVHVKSGRAWVCLPARPMLNSEGCALRDGLGKVRYVPPIRWNTPELAGQFSERVVELVHAGHPGALDDRSEL